VAGTVRAALEEGEVVMIGARLDAATLEELATGARQRLVLASLPTGDVTGTLARLGELLPDRTRLARLLAGVMVQRLVRRLCPACAEDQVVSELPEPQQHLLHDMPTAHVRRAVGCAECRDTGYRGRLAIAGVLPITSELRDALMKGAPAAQLMRVAREQGFQALWDAGLRRVLDGTTTLAELLDTVRSPTDDGGGPPQEDIDALLTQLLGESMQGDAHLPDASLAAPITEGSLGVVIDPIDETPASQVAAPTTAPATGGGALRVLIVDDDSAARRALAQVLTAAGLQVLQAADGVSALAFARRLRPDLVLTEIALPGLDAIGLVTALKEDTDAPMVVVHTEQEDDALDAWLIESGARAVVRRDVAGAELVARLLAIRDKG